MRKPGERASARSATKPPQSRTEEGARSAATRSTNGRSKLRARRKTEAGRSAKDEQAKKVENNLLAQAAKPNQELPADKDQVPNTTEPRTLKEKRRDAKAQVICTTCFKQQAIPGQTRCSSCAENHRGYLANQREKRKDNSEKVADTD